MSYFNHSDDWHVCECGCHFYGNDFLCRDCRDRFEAELEASRPEKDSSQ